MCMMSMSGKKFRQRGQSQQENVVIFIPLKCVAVVIVPIKSLKERLILCGAGLLVHFTLSYNVYEIECDFRASMAHSLVHPALKRGHSPIMYLPRLDQKTSA